LAGGLSPENVYDGIRFVKPAGVDSCTGTNRRDHQGRPIRFKKDMERLRRFVEETRRAAASLPENRDTDARASRSHS
jgi:phosphoribosylanthranilate isomerase